MDNLLKALTLMGYGNNLYGQSRALNRQSDRNPFPFPGVRWQYFFNQLFHGGCVV